MSCDHELANEMTRCSGKNASYITISFIKCSTSSDNITTGNVFFFFKSVLFLNQQTGEGNDGTDKEGAEDSLEAMPPKSASQASRSSKASRKKVSLRYITNNN